MKGSKDIPIEVFCPYCRKKVESFIPYNCRPIGVHKYDTYALPLPSTPGSWKWFEKTVKCNECRKEFHVAHSEGKDFWKYYHPLEKIIIEWADKLKRETKWGEDSEIIRRIWTSNELRKIAAVLLFSFVLFFLWPNFVHFLLGYDYPRDYYIAWFGIGTFALIFFYKIIRDIKINVGKIEENIRKGEEETKPEEKIIFPFNKKKIESKSFDSVNKTPSSISLVDLSFSIIFSEKRILWVFSFMLLYFFVMHLDKIPLTFAWIGNYFLIAVAFPLTIGFLYFLYRLPTYLSGELFSLKTKINNLSQVATWLITLLVFMVVTWPAYLLLANPEALPQQGFALFTENILIIAYIFMPILIALILFFTKRYTFNRIIKTIHGNAFEKLNEVLEPKISNLEKIENLQSIQGLLGLYDRIEKSRSEYYTALRNAKIFLVNLIVSLLPIIILIVRYYYYALISIVSYLLA